MKATSSSPVPEQESSTQENVPVAPSEPGPELSPDSPTADNARTFRIAGDVPPEVWNRLGTRVLPKLRTGVDVKVGIEFSVTVDGPVAQSFVADLRQILDDLGLAGRVHVEG